MKICTRNLWSYISVIHCVQKFLCINIMTDSRNVILWPPTSRSAPGARLRTSALKPSSSGAAALHRAREKDDRVMKIRVQGCLAAVFFMMCCAVMTENSQTAGIRDELHKNLRNKWLRAQLLRGTLIVHGTQIIKRCINKPSEENKNKTRI